MRRSRQDGYSTYYLTRAVFVRLKAALLLWSLLCWYVQAPGLVGTAGLQPAAAHEAALREAAADCEDGCGHPFWKAPSLVWAASFLGLDHDRVLDASALIGMLAAGCVVVGVSDSAGTLVVAWASALSVYAFGQTFFTGPGDTLLLEVALVAALWCPLRPGRGGGFFLSHDGSSRPSRVPLWLLRFALFKVLLLGGVAKVTRGGSPWADLTAVHRLLEAQPLPTPLAWYVFHAPMAVQKLAAALCLLTELPGAFVVLVPFRSVRHAAAATHGAVQLLMLATGNSGDTGLLVLLLLVALVDDSVWLRVAGLVEGVSPTVLLRAHGLPFRRRPPVLLPGLLPEEAAGGTAPLLGSAAGTEGEGEAWRLGEDDDHSADENEDNADGGVDDDDDHHHDEEEEEEEEEGRRSSSSSGSGDAGGGRSPKSGEEPRPGWVRGREADEPGRYSVRPVLRQRWLPGHSPKPVSGFVDQVEASRSLRRRSLLAVALLVTLAALFMFEITGARETGVFWPMDMRLAVTPAGIASLMSVVVPPAAWTTAIVLGLLVAEDIAADAECARRRRSGSPRSASSSPSSRTRARADQGETLVSPTATAGTSVPAAAAAAPPPHPSRGAKQQSAEDRDSGGCGGWCGHGTRLLVGEVILLAGLAPLAMRETSIDQQLPALVFELHDALLPFGVGGAAARLADETALVGSVPDWVRPEVVVEVALAGRPGESCESPEASCDWVELDFGAKPGRPVRAPSWWTGPYEPRLDWQMAVAARQSSAGDTSWLLHLMDDLLVRPEVAAELVGPDVLPSYFADLGPVAGFHENPPADAGRGGLADDAFVEVRGHRTGPLLKGAGVPEPDAADVPARSLPLLLATPAPQPPAPEVPARPPRTVAEVQRSGPAGWRYARAWRYRYAFSSVAEDGPAVWWHRSDKVPFSGVVTARDAWARDQVAAPAHLSCSFPVVCPLLSLVRACASWLPFAVLATLLTALATHSLGDAVARVRRLWQPGHARLVGVVPASALFVFSALAMVRYTGSGRVLLVVAVLVAVAGGFLCAVVRSAASRLARLDEEASFAAAAGDEYSYAAPEDWGELASAAAAAGADATRGGQRLQRRRPRRDKFATEASLLGVTLDEDTDAALSVATLLRGPQAFPRAPGAGEILFAAGTALAIVASATLWYLPLVLLWVAALAATATCAWVVHVAGRVLSVVCPVCVALLILSSGLLGLATMSLQAREYGF